MRIIDFLADKKQLNLSAKNQYLHSEFYAKVEAVGRLTVQFENLISGLEAFLQPQKKSLKSIFCFSDSLKVSAKG